MIMELNEDACRARPFDCRAAARLNTAPESSARSPQLADRHRYRAYLNFTQAGADLLVIKRIRSQTA